MNNNFDIVTIGAATRDVFLQSDRFKSVKNSEAPDGFDACFPLGSKIDLDEVLFETGGGATNAAVTFARFGLKTACVARIGQDLGGLEIKEKLALEKIDVSHLQIDPKLRTGYSLILLSGAGFRSILVFRGASRNLKSTALDPKKVSAKWFYMSSVGGNEKLLRDIFTIAKKSKTRVAWNPGNAELAHGLKKLTPLLLETDILILNREEAASLAEAPPRHLESILNLLGTLPRQALVVTDGEEGAFVYTRGTTWYSPAISGKRVNTTGAGDAFGSAFVAEAMQSGNLEKGLRAGMLNSFGVITHMGAKAGILKRAPTEAEMKRVKVRKA